MSLLFCPATLPAGELERRLADADAAVIMKIGRNLAKVRRALERTGRLKRAIYIERGTMGDAIMLPLAEKPDDAAPYFAIVLVPGWEDRAVSGRAHRHRARSGQPRTRSRPRPRWRSPTHRRSTAMAPISTRVPTRPGPTRHPSDNREEAARAAAALRHAAEGARVALVSGGDPGVFAMAAAVCAAVEAGPPAWRALEITVVPGITAMLAVAARVGAPLGHDFCAMSLSDNLEAVGRDRAPT